jgi:hypothetical protein
MHRTFVSRVASGPSIAAISLLFFSVLLIELRRKVIFPRYYEGLARFVGVNTSGLQTSSGFHELFMRRDPWVVFLDYGHEDGHYALSLTCPSCF